MQNSNRLNGLKTLRLIQCFFILKSVAFSLTINVCFSGWLMQFQPLKSLANPLKLHQTCASVCLSQGCGLNILFQNDQQQRAKQKVCEYSEDCQCASNRFDVPDMTLDQTGGHKHSFHTSVFCSVQKDSRCVFILISNQNAIIFDTT